MCQRQPERSGTYSQSSAQQRQNLEDLLRYLRETTAGRMMAKAALQTEQGSQTAPERGCEDAVSDVEKRPRDDSSA